MAIPRQLESRLVNQTTGTTETYHYARQAIINMPIDTSQPISATALVGIAAIADGTILVSDGVAGQALFNPGEIEALSGASVFLPALRAAIMAKPI